MRALLHQYTSMEDSRKPPSSLLILCSLDGTLTVLDAWTGRLVRRWDSESPLYHHHSGAKRPELSTGLDGKLYVSQQSRSTGGLASEQPQVWSLSMDHLVEQPVRTCRSDTDCGIITATAKTSLWSLSADTGELLWKTAHPYVNKDEQQVDRDQNTVLLQRKDYHLQELSTSTGYPLWNSTYSTWVALEFDEEGDDDEWLEPWSPHTKSTRTTPRQPALPAIAFLPEGGMVAMNDVYSSSNDDQHQQQVLWHVKAPIASVFGLHRGKWKSPLVLAPPDKSEDSSLPWQPRLPPAPPKTPLALPSPDDGPQTLLLPAPPVSPGIYVPWSLVTVLGVLLVGIVLGARAWYTHKKHKWMSVNSRDNPVATPSTNTTSSNSQNNSVVPSRYTSEFEELEHLGRGGFGSVYRVRNVLDGREYAMKKIAVDAMLDRVLREVKILARLEDHAHIVRYYTAWLEQGDNNEPEETNAPGNETSGLDTSTVSRRFQQTSAWSMGQGALGSPLGRMNQNRGLHLYSETTNDLSLRFHLFDASSHGIIFEESTQDLVEKSSNSTVAASQQPKEASTSPPSASPRSSRAPSSDVHLVDEIDSDDEGTRMLEEPAQPPVHHTLYIQMELCSSNTLMDYLLRQGDRHQPHALRLFWQVAQAVAHVHERGLIHRDLKPSNCFLDDSGETVKIGDFGLSRESNAAEPKNDGSSPNSKGSDAEDLLSHDDDGSLITGGVGTKSYASPEQMSQSSYGASTDIYSLGIILFELVYPFSTGMERNICLSRLRQSGDFPSDWDDVTGDAADRLRQGITRMVQTDPSARPTADEVVRLVQDLLGEHTILSFEPPPDCVLVRVCVSSDDDLLPCMQALKSSGSEIVQYGQRSRDDCRILEFAVRGDSEQVDVALKKDNRDYKILS